MVSRVAVAEWREAWVWDVGREWGCVGHTLPAMVTHDHNDLKMEEQNIICGALELHKKTVGEVMTKLEDVYMLSVDRNLDFDTINEIMQQAFNVFQLFMTNSLSLGNRSIFRD
ncbi:Metal transporter CNNM4 [Portunus trituberculatus]|uniref:Metal transporter CNNM4 n=1 Tax=Portunus trituberculatus TaxID=210409 RepID=A0A5B7I1S2_PORTR|nr:Metal transporter CNNM4 [Portunus trituberculatus]